jgi:hypothetical protein
MRREPDFTQNTQQMMKLWQEWARMWAGYMTPFMGPMAGMWQMPFGAASPSGSEATLRMSIRTSRPVDVSFRLHRAPPNKPLSARLHAESGEESFTLKFDSANEGLAVELPEGQAAGLYRGFLVDDSGEEYGAITLRLR